MPSDAPHPESPAAVPSTGGKRKRKSEGGRGKATDRGSDDETAASGSDNPRQTAQQAQTQAQVDLKKRTKTVGVFFSCLGKKADNPPSFQQRACDSCRARKIRCDVITDSVCDAFFVPAHRLIFFPPGAAHLSTLQAVWF